MKLTLLGALPATAAAAALFAITAAAQTDQQPTHAELVQHWAEAALDTQLKTMKTNLRLTADQEKLWGPFESAVKDGAKARVLALQKEQSDNLSPMDRLNATAERLAPCLDGPRGGIVRLNSILPAGALGRGGA